MQVSHKKTYCAVKAISKAQCNHQGADKPHEKINDNNVLEERVDFNSIVYNE